MRQVFCDWPECEHWEGTPVEEEGNREDEIYGGRCTKTVIRMYRGPVHSNNKAKDPPTCSWYTEREKEND